MYDYTSTEHQPAYQADRTLEYHGEDEITALTYDSSGNLYVGIHNTRTNESHVDEYYPHSTTVDATFRKGIYGAGSLLTDPHGNLYIANTDFGHRNITWYKRGSDSALTIDTEGFGLLTDLAWGDEDNWLWVADYSKSALRAYRIDDDKGTSSLAWTICNSNCNLRDSHLDHPSALSSVGGNLYVLNVPLVGSDNVSEYGIHKTRDPYWAREIDTYQHFHFINAITTDASQKVYLAESTKYVYVDQKYGIFAYDAGGGFAYGSGDLPHPVISMVADSAHGWLYAAEGKPGSDVVVYHDQLARYGVVRKPDFCHVTKLAITPSY